MGHRIGVAMTDQPGTVEHDATQHHGSVRVIAERMDVEALSDPHVRNRRWLSHLKRFPGRTT
ncbi:MAG: hypothetical protein Ct9H300mP12_01610 [Acidimicrobiales bacterium]|nr:MAG: hypothetical protein Ct9H300mP12_01610 [Acidimicrobiales bacterium]